MFTTSITYKQHTAPDRCTDLTHGNIAHQIGAQYFRHMPPGYYKYLNNMK